MFEFITKRPLWVNILVAGLMTVLMIFLFLQLLGFITRHGEYMKIPKVTGMNTRDAIKLLENQGFDVVIQDSVYIETEEKGVVLKQLPDPQSTVKVNRAVFLTVNRETLPMIDMPALEGKTLGFALEILRRSHLQLGDTISRPDFMRGSVLEQRFNGEKIVSGAKLPWGSRISLVIGGGLANEQIEVPQLLRLTFSEAKIVLEQNGISIGALILEPNVRDTAAAYIYQQSPEKLNSEGQISFMQSGQLMDLWLSADQRVSIDSTGN